MSKSWRGEGTGNINVLSLLLSCGRPPGPDVVYHRNTNKEKQNSSKFLCLFPFLVILLVRTRV